MKVLIATDGSDQATTALRTASRMIRREDLQVDLICVAPQLVLPHEKRGRKTERSERLKKEYLEKIGRETDKILNQGRGVLEAEGITAQPRSLIGSPAPVIIGESIGYDLTVVGAHDKYQRTKPGLGKVASRVVSQASGAVLVARDFGYERALRILIGVDGSLASEQAIEFLVNNFKADSADIMLMHVVETPWMQIGLDREWFDYPGGLFRRADPGARIDQEVHIESEEVIETARRRLESRGFGSEMMIVDGDPALEMLSEAEKGDYDLIVLGATGETDLKHNMLGSVSTKIAQDAPCSVLIVKFMG
ncbi:MAG: universal stress protein [Acidobacteriota bacterium]|nr:MAG: universal stress protein [Acidobacteriota bacterium]